MRSERRELHFPALASACVSLLLLGIATYKLANEVGVWSTLSGAKKALAVAGLMGGLALAVSSFWQLGSRSKAIGRIHGSLMAVATAVLLSVGYHSLPDRTHPRGEIFEALQFLGAAIWIVLAIFAAGCSLASILGSAEKKENA